MNTAPSFDYGNITQLTREQAVDCGENQHWQSWSLEIRALFQVHQSRLCMPLEVYHEALTKTLGRIVLSHEIYLNQPRLRAELLGLAGAPTIDQIIALLARNVTTIAVA